MHALYALDAISAAKRGQQFGRGQVVAGGQPDGGGVDVQRGGEGLQQHVGRVQPLQAGVAAGGEHGAPGLHHGALWRWYVGHAEDQRCGACGVGLALDAQHAFFDQQRRQVGLAQVNGFFHPLGVLGVQGFEAGAVGLGQLVFQRFFIAGRQIDAGGQGIAGHLTQAAGGGLQHKVVAGGQLSHQCAGKQAGAVPALCAHVDQQQHAVGGGGVACHGLKSAARGVAGLVVHGQQCVGADAVGQQGGFDGGAQFIACFQVGKVQRQAGRCAVLQNDRPVVPHKVVDDALHHLRRFAVAQLQHLDAAGQFFQHAIADALTQAVPDHHVAQGLTLKVGRAGGVDGDDEVGCPRQVVNGATHFLDALVLENGLAGFLVFLPFAQQLLAVGVMRFVREHRQMRQRGNGLQSQIGQRGGFFVLDAREEAVLRGIAHSGFLDADFFGVGDDDVEAAAQRDGDFLGTIAGEGELEAGGKGLVQAGRQQSLEGDVGQLAQRAQNSLAGREEQGVLHERAVRVFERHGEFGGDDGAHEDGLARAHGQRQDIAGIVEREGFAQGLQPVFFNKRIVGFQASDDLVQTGVGNQFRQRFGVEAHGCPAFAFGRKERGVQVRDTRRVQHQSQVPVGFQRPKLRLPQIA